MSKRSKHNSSEQDGAPILTYVVRRSFVFAGRQYMPSDEFADIACDGEKLKRLQVARLIEFAHVVAERGRISAEPVRPAKVVRNTQVG